MERQLRHMHIGGLRFHRRAAGVFCVSYGSMTVHIGVRRAFRRWGFSDECGGILYTWGMGTLVLVCWS